MDMIYDQIMREHFDILDNKTRRTLLSVNEADRTNILVSLSNKLYDSIMKKVDDIDYGGIPVSKGDITKIPNYLDMVECLNTIRELLVETNQSTTPVDIVLKTIDNLRDSKRDWGKAFAINSDLCIIIYNNIAMGVVGATSYLISSSIEFIKDPSVNSFNIALDKAAYAKSKDALIYKNLEKFNKAYLNGDIQKTTKSLLSATTKIGESGLNEEDVVSESILTTIGGISVGVTVLLIMIIPLLRFFVTLWFDMQQSFSDFLALQADLIQMNAERLKEDRIHTEEQKKKIYEKQTKIATRFRKASNFFMVKYKKSEKVADKESKDNEKYKIDDVEDTKPDSSIF